MSIDVNYYSFSPSRADKKWGHFIEDMTVLRKKNSYQKEREKNYHPLGFSKKSAEIEAHFETLIEQARKKIFDHFNAKGYYIPWIEWNENQGVDNLGRTFNMTDEDKMNYLLVYGCVYPKGTDLNEKNHPYSMLWTDAAELGNEYEKIKEEFDLEIAKLFETPRVDLQEGEKVILNDRQEKLTEEVDLSYLIYEDAFNEEQLINDLKYLDIYYGSVVNEYFESPKIEFTFLETIVDIFQLKNDNGIPTKEEWIRAFQNITTEKIQQATNVLMKELHWDEDEAGWGIRDYLRSVKPIAKDLKENPDAFFVRSYGGYNEVEPEKSESLLLERARMHAEKYKGLLQPVL